MAVKPGVRSWAARIGYLGFGSLLAAVGLELFLIPNGLLDGGVTGIAIMVSYLTGWPIGALLVVLNVPFLSFGYKQIGMTFAVSTLLAVAFLGLFVTLLTPVPSVTQDLLLVSVFGGILVGSGSGFVIRHAGSLDGVEAVALSVSRWSGFSVGEVVMALNAAIFVTAGFVFTWERALYSLFAYMAAFRVIDLVVQGLDESRAVLIIAQDEEPISQAIQARLGRGVTLLNAQGGHSDEARRVLYTVVSRLEMAKLRVIVEEFDPNAFIVVQPVAEVSGGRFRKRAIH